MKASTEKMICSFNEGFNEDHIKLRKIINKSHKSSSSIAFIKKALYHVIPTFVKVKCQFLGNTTIKNTAKKELMQAHLDQHYNDLKELTFTYHLTVKFKNWRFIYHVINITITKIIRSL